MRSPDFLSAVGIGVTDLARSTAYYETVLGMTKVRTYQVEYMDAVLLAHEGRNAIILMHYTDGSVRNYQDNPVNLVFDVTDPAAIAAKAKAAGMEVIREPTPSRSGALVCLTKDPDGYRIELIRRGDEAKEWL